MLAWYRDLISLRRTTPGFGDGRLDRVRARYDEQAGWIVVERGRLRVVANLGEADAKVDVEEPGSSEVLLVSDDRITLDAGTATLPPDSVLIFGESPSLAR